MFGYTSRGEMVFQSEKRRRVAIFGGSFNPPHIGHTAICKWLFNRGIIDEIWVTPCFIHPFGKELVSYEHRLAMTRLAFGKLMMPIKVLEIEKELGGVSYTLRTVEQLRKLNPEISFHLVTGSDVEEEIEKWKDFDRIKNLVGIIRIPRGDQSIIPDVSSTEIRNRIQNSKSYRDLVEVEVAVYIITKGLFR